MLQLTELDLAIAQRLNPLRQALNDAQIPVATLPNEAGSYSESNELGTIRIVIPDAIGILSETSGIQDIEYTIVIAIALNKRYQQSINDRGVIEFVANEVTRLLLGFNPFENEVVRAISFSNYNLFQPRGKTWEAEVIFKCAKKIRAEDSIKPKDDLADELKVSLYAIASMQIPDPALIKEVAINV